MRSRSEPQAVSEQRLLAAFRQLRGVGPRRLAFRVDGSLGSTLGGSAQGVLLTGETDPSSRQGTLDQQRSVAASAVSNFELPSLGQRDREADKLVHRETRLRHDLPVELVNRTEPLTRFDVGAISPRIRGRLWWDDTKDQRQSADRGGLGPLGRRAQVSRESVRRGPTVARHLAGALVIRAIEISHPMMRKSGPREYPLRTDLVPDESLREIEPSQVTGVAIF